MISAVSHFPKIGAFFAGLMLFGTSPAWAQTEVQPAPLAGSPVNPATAPVSDAEQAPEDPTLEEYVLGPGDWVAVNVLVNGTPVASGLDRAKIDIDGTVTVSLLEDVQAGGKTLSQLQADIRKGLMDAQLFVDPVVIVNVASYASRYVTVLGAVATPSRVVLDRPKRVSDILAQVGGVRANGAEFLTLRRKSGGAEELNIRDIAIGDEDADPFVKPGDKLFVGEAKKFYVEGQVGVPGTKLLRGNMTLRKALASSGGITSLGSRKRVKIYRDGEELTGVNLSTKIRDEDVIFVGERFF